MNTNKGRHPDWVKKYVDANHTVKRDKGQFWLYKDGELLGMITQEGFEPVQQEHISFGPWEVYEYGASKVLLHICPRSWRTSRGATWMDDLCFIISKESPKSYLLRGRKASFNGNVHLAKAKLNLFLKEELKTSFDEIYTIMSDVSLLINTSTGEKSLTRLSDKQLSFLTKLGLSLEVF